MKHKSAFVGLYPGCIMTSELLQVWWEYILRYVMALRVCRGLGEEGGVAIYSVSRVGTHRLWRTASPEGKCKDLRDM